MFYFQKIEFGEFETGQIGQEIVNILNYLQDILIHIYYLNYLWSKNGLDFLILHDINFVK